MRRALRMIPLLAALSVPAGLVPRADAQVSIQFRWGTHERPLAGSRYQTMRALAHELDERARHAFEQVASTTRRSRAERRLLGALEDFADRAADFHERMDSYSELPWNVPPVVQDLAERAREVSYRFRRVPVLRHTAQDWGETTDVVNRMLRVLQGYDIPHEWPYRWDRDRDEEHGQERDEEDRPQPYDRRQ